MLTHRHLEVLMNTHLRNQLGMVIDSYIGPHPGQSTALGVPVRGFGAADPQPGVPVDSVEGVTMFGSTEQAVTQHGGSMAWCARTGESKSTTCLATTVTVCATTVTPQSQPPQSQSAPRRAHRSAPKMLVVDGK